jgi:hypothetical protein
VAQAASSSENTNNGNASAPYSAGITCQAHRHRHVKVDGTDSGATHPGDRDKWGPIVRGRVHVIHHHAVVRRQRILDCPPLPYIAVAGVWPAPSVIAREQL